MSTDDKDLAGGATRREGRSSPVEKHWRMIGDPPTRAASGDLYGAGVCLTGACIEPCGRNGGCSR